MAKQTTGDQHRWLEQKWPGDCCLCTKETELGNLKSDIRQVQMQLNMIAINSKDHEEAYHIAADKIGKILD